MRLVGKEKLQSIMRSNESAHTWLCAWIAEFAEASWKQAADVSHQFPNVREADSGQFFFPIAGCDTEVCIQIAFPQGIAVIVGIQ